MENKNFESLTDHYFGGTFPKTKKDIKMKKRIEDVLSKLYDYEYIDIEKFYNDKYNTELINKVEKGSVWAIQELYDSLDNFIKFETDYNSCIGVF